MRDGLRILHHIDQQATTHMPGDMAVECPDAGIACSHLPYQVTARWQQLHVPALRVRWIDYRATVPAAEANVLLRRGG